MDAYPQQPATHMINCNAKMQHQEKREQSFPEWCKKQFQL
jgi:hypothetical protein